MAYMRSKMDEQESQISAYDKLIQGVGHDIKLSDDAHSLTTIEGKPADEILEYVIELQDDPESAEPRARKIFEGADQLLNDPFSFYSFSVGLNHEQ